MYPLVVSIYITTFGFVLAVNLLMLSLVEEILQLVLVSEFQSNYEPSNKYRSCTSTSKLP